MPLVNARGNPGREHGANPFWSERVRTDHVLEQTRPQVAPPVPNDDDFSREGNRGTPSSMGEIPIRNVSRASGTPRSQPRALRTQGLARETPSEQEVAPRAQMSQGPVQRIDLGVRVVVMKHREVR